MKFFETMTDNVTKAVDFVVEKNRKAALINRIRIVIKNERENEARAYVALGKYYYEKLRDGKDEKTEPLCRSVDLSAAKIKKAFAKLDEITAPEGCGDDDEYAGCGDCCCCTYEDEEPVGVHAAPDEEETPSASSIINKANETAPPADETDEKESEDRAGEEAAEDEPLDPGI
jgi:hypothetical protein